MNEMKAVDERARQADECAEELRVLMDKYGARVLLIATHYVLDGEAERLWDAGEDSEATAMCYADDAVMEAVVCLA